MTLMEILVVLAIIGMMVGASVGALNVFSDVEFEKLTGELSSTLRYLHGEAARRNEIYRLVINLDEERYVVESAPNSPETLAEIAAQDGDQSEKEKVAGEEDTNAAADTAAESSDAAASEEAPPPQGFAQAAEAALNPRSISPLFFKDVFVGHSPAKIDQGIAYIYFFPNGSTEYAIINVSDEEEQIFYSVEMNPLTGKTKIRDQYYENPY
jgi:general secretion pathway protein H